MNVYFLVEGRRTEAQVYPAWLTVLLPTFKQVGSPGEASRQCYFLISGNGYPSVVQETLKNAIADVNEHGNYDYLVVCLDADDLSVAERLDEIEAILAQLRFGDEDAWKLTRTQLQFVIQNRTIETWFLGNRKLLTAAPQGDRLRQFLKFQDVSELDPETIKLHPTFEHLAEFHHEYLKEIFRERGLAYKKRDPGHVKDKTYLEQLRARVDVQPGALKSFQTFTSLCHEIQRQALL
jgi:hypothetical protein